MRRALALLVVAGVVLGTAGQAAPPDHPVTFVSVDELKKTLDRGVKTDIIDVRHWDAYVEMHITGARSMPLRAVAERSGEISKTGFVVFY